MQLPKPEQALGSIQVFGSFKAGEMKIERQKLLSACAIPKKKDTQRQIPQREGGIVIFWRGVLHPPTLICPSHLPFEAAPSYKNVQYEFNNTWAPTIHPV